MRNARRRAREFAVQGVYEWLLSGNAPDVVARGLAEVKGFESIDRDLFDALLRGAITRAPQLEEQFAGYVDRPVKDLSPVERAILLLGVYELLEHIETPYRVVINECVELAKSYGGTDGHKYVNGVLDRVAAKLRAVEVQARGGRRSPPPG